VTGRHARLALLAAAFAGLSCDRAPPASQAAPPLILDATNGTGTLNSSVFADSYQVYVYDAKTEPIFISAWNRQTISDKLAVKPGAIAFCPLREMDVPVTVRVQPAPPDSSAATWDHIVECSLDVPSGRVLIMGPIDTPAARVDLTPGSYRVRISSAGLGTISPDGLHGQDRYELCFWPAEISPPQVLKRYSEESASAPRATSAPVEP
jgi:hypothetical protein